MRNYPSKERYDIEKEVIDQVKQAIEEIEKKCFKRFINSSHGEENENIEIRPPGCLVDNIRS